MQNVIIITKSKYVFLVRRVTVLVSIAAEPSNERASILLLVSSVSFCAVSAQFFFAGFQA